VRRVSEFYALQALPLTFIQFVQANNNVIYMNPEIPGDQGEGLHMCKFWGLAHGTDEYDGVIIDLPVDYFDHEDDVYSIYFEEGTNKAVFSKPLLASPWRNDKALYDARMAAAAGDHAYIRKGLDAARAFYNKKTTEGKQKKFDLVFPAGYQLSQRVWPPNVVGIEGEPMMGSKKSWAWVKQLGRNDANGDAMVYYPQVIQWKFVNLASRKEMQAAGGGTRAAQDEAFVGI
jgi:hypothetical protein